MGRVVRAVIVRRGTSARIWSRQRNDITDRFPDVAKAAAAQLDDGVVVDGELVIMVDGRLSFDALQRRLVTTPAKARRMVALIPASYVAFDLLAYGGVDLRTQRWTTRRARLEQLASRWRPPQGLLVPHTQPRIPPEAASAPRKCPESRCARSLS